MSTPTRAALHEEIIRRMDVLSSIPWQAGMH